MEDVTNIKYSPNKLHKILQKNPINFHLLPFTPIHLPFILSQGLIQLQALLYIIIMYSMNQIPQKHCHQLSSSHSQSPPRNKTTPSLPLNPQIDTQIKQLSSTIQIHSQLTNTAISQLSQKLQSQQTQNKKIIDNLNRTQTIIKKLSQEVEHLTSKQNNIKTITIKSIKNTQPSIQSKPDPEKEDRIRILEEELKKCQAENKELKQAINAEKAISKELSSSLRRQQQKYLKLIHKFDDKVCLLNKDIKRYQQKVHQLVRQLNQLNQVQRSSDIYNPQPIYNLIAHHPRNAHQAYYSLKKVSSTQAHITHSGPNGYYNLINKVEILPSHCVKYSVRIHKSNNNWILVGFCTAKGFGNINNYLHPKSVYYYCFSNGYLFEGGLKREGNGGCTVGDIIECIADLPNEKFTWVKDNHQIGQCSIPPLMKGKKLYFSALLYSKDDEIDLFI